MRSFVLSLAFLVDCFANGGAFSLPAQSLQRNLSDSETALETVQIADGNRALQSIDEERGPQEEVMPLLNFVAAEKWMPKKIEGPSAAKGKLLPSVVRRFKAIADKLIKIDPRKEHSQYENIKQQELVSLAPDLKYKMLQEVLGSTRKPKDYNKAVLCGYSPFSLKTMIDARGSMKLKPADKRMKLFRLQEYTKYYTDLIGSSASSDRLHEIYDKTFKTLTPNMQKKVQSMVLKVEAIIYNLDHDVSHIDYHKLLQADVSPVIYAQALTKFLKHWQKNPKIHHSGRPYVRFPINEENGIGSSNLSVEESFNHYREMYKSHLQTLMLNLDSPQLILIHDYALDT